MKRIIVMLCLIVCSGCSAQDQQLDPITLDVAWTIYEEAKGESYIGKLSVATVIYNRSNERNLTLSEVCRQRKQFSCWNSGREPTIKNNQVWKQCQQIAQSMTDGVFKPLDTWNHYYNPTKCSPSWGALMTNVKIVGNHKFGIL